MNKLLHTSLASTNIQRAIDRKLGPIVYRNPASLRPYPGNPRRHPEQQIVKLEASIGHFGFALPVLVSEAGEIIVGHARVIAAQRLGMTEVPALVVSDWSASEIRAYRLADNRLAELAQWDEEALSIELSAIIELDDTPIELLGWETAEIDVLLAQGAGASPAANDPADDIPEPPDEPVSQTGDLWQLRKHRLLCGSSLEPESWAMLLGSDVAAMVFTDPPYNVQINGHVSGLGKARHAEFVTASGELSTGEFTAFLTRSIGSMLPHLKDGAVLDICMDWRHMVELQAALEANSLGLLNLCFWNKTNGGMGSLYRSKHELVFIAKKGRVCHTNNVQLGRHGRYRTNVWDYAGVNSFGRTRMADLADHPTVKPVALVAEAIRDVTYHGEIVLDGFAGSGTTVLAAERTRRRCYAIEIEPRYVDVAVRRWEKLTGAKAALAGTGETFDEVAARRCGGTSADTDAN